MCVVGAPPKRRRWSLMCTLSLGVVDGIVCTPLRPAFGIHAQGRLRKALQIVYLQWFWIDEGQSRTCLGRAAG
jgi:hypothetical protein